MLAPFLAAALAQTLAPAVPKISVVVTQRSGMTDARAEQLAGKISDLLAARGVEIAHSPAQAAQALASAGMKSAVECQGRRGCVSGIGRVLRVWGVLGVELADLDGTVAAHLELVDSDKGQRLAELDAVMPSKRAEAELTAHLMPLVPRLKEILEAAAPNLAPQPEPMPVAAAPKPAPAAEAAVAAAPPARVEQRQQGRSLALPIVLFGGAAAAVVVSVIFAVLGSQAQSTLAMDTMGPGTFTVTRAQAQQLVNTANSDYTISLGTCIGAGVLAVTSLLVLLLT